MPKLIDLLKRTVSDWQHDDTGRMAASLAYYAAISIAPLLIVVIAVAGWVFGEDAARGAVMDQLGGVLGNDSAATVESMIAGADKPRTGLIATAMGIAVLLFGATGVFVELQSSMNAIWDVEPKPGGGPMAFIRHRVLSLAMVLGIAFLLLISLALSAGLTALGSALEPYIPGAPIVWELVMFGASFLIITLLFGMIFKVLPDVNVRYRDVWIGAAFTAALFVLGKFLVGIYLKQADVATSYGAAGSVVVMLLWVYYSAHIFFFGAEFTQAYAHLHGSRWEPTRDAIPAQHGKHPERRAGGRELNAPLLADEQRDR
ncbi:MAG: YihY/virulence factor BrkB family protein [Deltaproteobacteria bacterium]|nr:YihY/virulence factor BrkB family protein [Nannocystaceae bacterium]